MSNISNFKIIESTLREGEQFANAFFDSETKIEMYEVPTWSTLLADGPTDLLLAVPRPLTNLASTTSSSPRPRRQSSLG